MIASQLLNFKCKQALNLLFYLSWFVYMSNSDILVSLLTLKNNFSQAELLIKTLCGVL